MTPPDAERPFARVVRFHLVPGHEAAFDLLAAAMVDAVTANEPDTLAYTVHEVDGVLGERVFYELYRTHGAFEEHERQPHTRRILAELDEHITSFDVDRLRVSRSCDRRSP